MKRHYKKTGKNDSADNDKAGQEFDDLIWGINSVTEALIGNPRSLSEVLVQRGKAGPKFQEIIDKAREGMSESVLLKWIALVCHHILNIKEW